MPYPAALALHLIAVMLFVGGLFVAALILRGDAPATPARLAELGRIDRWNLFVTTPALLLVWAMGAVMAEEAGWFAAAWLSLKLGCVALLSLLHFAQSLRLHRAVGGQIPRQPGGITASAAALVVLVVYLVAVKPF